MNGRAVRCAAVALVTVTLAGCAGSSASDDGPDASAELACTHFRNIVGDARVGILTDAELRAKFKEVYDTAYVSATPGIAPGARDLLAGITSGTTAQFRRALDDFSSSCSAVGL